MRGNRSEQSSRGKWKKPAADRGLVKIGSNWYVRFSSNGRVVTEKVGPSQAQARKALIKRKAAVMDGKFFPNEVRKNVPFSEIVDDCLKKDLASFAAKGHDRRRKFRDSIHKKLTEWFGDHAAASLTAEELEEKIRGHARTAATYNHYRIVLSKTFKLGMRNRKVAASPVVDVERRKIDNARVRYLNQHEPLPTGDPRIDALPTEEERLRAAIRTIAPNREAELDLALSTGLRDEEQRGLTWANVDFTAKIATLGWTKAGGKQHVRLNAGAIAALRKLRAQHPDSKLVCPADGPGSNRRSDWDRARALVKLDEKTRGVEEAFHWHDLRHTFASRLAMQGVPILTINKLLRHSPKDLSVTMRYAHLAPEHLAEALDKLDELSAKCNASVMAGADAAIAASPRIN